MVFCYMPLVRYLDPDQPCYGLQMREPEDGQVSYRSIEDMAAEYNMALREIQPHGPYFLGGWSFGGLVAFEMAQQLLHQDQVVALLALLDSLAPPPKQQPADDTLHPDFDDDIARVFIQFVGPENIPLSEEEFLRLEMNERLIYATEALQKAKIVPPDTNMHQILHIVHMLQTNEHAAMSYVPQPYPERITLFCAELSDDRTETKRAVDRTDPANGWSALSPQPVEVYRVPGTHATMVSEPHVSTLAERLRICLSQPPS
jgi:thioesterase domain-containing protein